MSKVGDFKILRAVRLPFLDTNEQVVHEAGTRSVQTLKKQAIKLFYRNVMISPLIDYAKQVKSPNFPQYWKVLQCCTTLQQSQNKYLTPTHRCGSRLCSICANIRTAKTVDKVYPLFDLNKKWGYLTLTRANKDLRSASAEKLRNVVIDMYWQLSKIRQRAKRKFGEIDAVITLEVQPEGYKRKKETKELYYGYYNPHFNIIAQYEHLEFIREEWLKLIICSEQNQKLKEVLPENLKESLLELVKYTMKGVTTFKKASKPFFINLEAVDTIMTALKGKRRLITWGCFYKKNIDKIEEAEIADLDLEKYIYNDIPITDIGNRVGLVDGKGILQSVTNEFIKTVYWEFDNRMCNYFYLDDWGDKHWLLDWKKIPEKPQVYFTIGRKKYQPEISTLILN
jgi:hypothetical protein